MNRPTLNPDVSGSLRQGLETSSPERLAWTLANILRAYVIEDDVAPFNLPVADSDVPQEAAERRLSFTELITQLKRRLDLVELDWFQIEQQRVTLQIDNQKITFGDQATVQFVPFVPDGPPSQEDERARQRDAAERAVAQVGLSRENRDALGAIVDEMRHRFLEGDRATPRFATRLTQDIARQLQSFPADALVRSIQYFVETRIIKGTMPVDLPDADFARVKAEDEEPFTFPDLIGRLKKRLTLPELHHFFVEDDRVTIRVHNQKVVFDGGEVSIKFVATGPQAQQMQTKSRPSKVASKAPDAPAAPPPPREPEVDKEKLKDLDKFEQEALHDVMQRFKRLDLD